MKVVPSVEQRRIIGFPPDRPLRVEAGAGTGKTTTIVLRLQAAIEAGVAPERALGLTFTNKAAGELSDRLRQALPDLAAEGREVEVATYHGFAFGLLREFGAYVGVERDVRLIGPGYLRELIHQELSTGPGYEYLDLTYPPGRVSETAALLRQLADNLTAPGSLLALEDGDGDVAGKRRELALIAQRVQTTKQHLGLVDYSDLVRLAHQLLSEHPRVADRIAARYRVVLLDEYQDTDPAQRELLRRLFGNGFPLTAVGDPDQTIYEWRGASLANFAQFPDHFRQADGQPAPTLPLSTNRRSAQPILDLANSIRSELHGEGGYQVLEPAEKRSGAVVVSRYHSAGDEAVGIAQEVRRLADEEAVRWSDIAILFRKNAQIPLVRDALEAYDIPYEVAALGGLLSVPVVADLRGWLQILDDPAHAPSLLRILLGGSYRLGLGDLMPLAEWARRGPADQTEEDPGRPLLEAIDSLTSFAGLSPVAHERLQRFGDTYRRLLVVAQGLSLVELSRRVLDETETWAEIDALAPNASLTARLNLYRFLDLAEEWSPLQGRPSLGAFLGYLQTLDEDTASQELDMARVGDENVVAVLTIHRAKGLEWDNVFLPAAVRGTLPAAYRGGDDPTQHAAALPYDLRLDRSTLPDLTGDPKANRALLSEHHSQQELRTAYVAVTRAKTRLYVSGAHWYTEKTPKQAGVVMELALATPGVQLGTMVDEPGDGPGQLRLESATGSPDPVFPGGWEEALRTEVESPGSMRRLPASEKAYDEAMDQIEMMLHSLPMPAEPEVGSELTTSVTGLVTLAGCPQQFYWTEIDPLPQRNSWAMRRGVEVHRMIELHAQGQFPLWERADDVYDAPGAVEGRDVTGPYSTFKSTRFATRRARFVEVPIDLEMPLGRIRGRIDAVYEDEPGSWEIVDWKSGTVSSDPARLVQLQAYAVAAAAGLIGDQTPSKLRVTFCYLGGETAAEVSYDVTPQWLAQAEEALQAALQQASGPDYPQQPSERCRHCDFSRFCEAGTAWLHANSEPG